MTGTSPSQRTLFDLSEPYEVEREVYPDKVSLRSSNGVDGRDLAGERHDLRRLLGGGARGGRLDPEARVYESVFRGVKGVMLRLMTLAILFNAV